MPRSTGSVKSYNEEKGFGLILDEGGGKDVFVSHHEIRGPGSHRVLDVGERVEFDIVPGPNGPTAVNVLRLD
jgi:cold shock protein